MDGSSKPCNSADPPAAASRRAWPIRPSTTTPWRRPAPSWARAAWWCSTTATAWWTSRASSSIHAGRILRQVHLLPHRHQAHAGDPGAALRGQGRPDDLEKLETLADYVSRGSLCGLGQTAPNPVLTTLRYFREEYEAHLAGALPGRPLPGPDPLPRDGQLHRLHAVRAGLPGGRHRVSSVREARGGRPDLCTRCDMCRQACQDDAIEVA